MEQRRLRLGDILDDYCPRERRVTNHAVVAMIEEDVKQTRCTTCDAEHPYKGGQAPRRRRKETPSALYKEVLAGRPDADAPDAIPSSVSEPEVPAPIAAADDDFQDEPVISDDVAPETVTHEPEDDVAAAPPNEVEEGPVHRPLIRATLPRPEGQKDARPLPEFTVRQSGARGNSGNTFRGNARMKARGGFGGNGHRPGGPRFTGARPGQNRGQGGGFRSGQQHRHGGGKKRSR
jgi:hypothetical protein